MMVVKGFLCGLQTTATGIVFSVYALSLHHSEKRKGLQIVFFQGKAIIPV